jgi:YtxH-like protein
MLPETTIVGLCARSVPLTKEYAESWQRSGSFLLLYSHNPTFLEKYFMRRRKQNILLDLLLGSGAYLLYSMRHQFRDIEDFRDRARETYETASRRISRASDAIRGEDQRGVSTATALLMGVAGIGIGMLVPLASGKETKRAKERYETASRRIGRARDALRGQDYHTLSTTIVLLVGVAAGVGIGMIVAPASGEKARADISEKVKDVREKVRDRPSRKPQGASGTYGE